jgi:hypothetical protein
MSINELKKLYITDTNVLSLIDHLEVSIKLLDRCYNAITDPELIIAMRTYVSDGEADALLFLSDEIEEHIDDMA